MPAINSTTIITSSNASATQVHGTLIRQTAPPPAEERGHRFNFGLKRALTRGAKPSAPVNSPTETQRRASAVTSVAFTAKPAQKDYTTRLTAVRIPPDQMTMRTVSESAPVKLQSSSAESKRSERAGGSERSEGDNFRPLNFGERMLRNTAVCVAVLLCAIAIKSIDAPIAQTVSGELREWVTMDLDESLGSLKFVQNLLPDAALVFWHIGSTQTYAEPAIMTLSHSWRENEPYLTYTADRQTPVTASAPGEVMSVSVSNDRTYTVRIRHTDGLETIYGNMEQCMVHEGDAIETAQTIGAATELYFEIRGEGRSMNPVPLMAAKP